MYINLRKEKLKVKKKRGGRKYKLVEENKIYTIGMIDGCGKLSLIGVVGSFKTDQFIYIDGTEIPEDVKKRYNYYDRYTLEKMGHVLCVDNSPYPELVEMKTYKAEPIYALQQNYDTHHIRIKGSDKKYHKTFFRVLKDQNEINMYSRLVKLRYLFKNKL